MQDFDSISTQLEKAGPSLSGHYSDDNNGNKYLPIFNGEQKPIGRLYHERNGPTFIFTDGDSRDKLIKTGTTIPAFLCDLSQISAFEDKMASLRKARDYES